MNKKIIFFVFLVLLLLVGWVERDQFRPPLLSLSDSPADTSQLQTQVGQTDENVQPIGLCEQYKKQFADLNSLKQSIPLKFNFENIHLSVNGNIYRLRHFYKDAQEGQIETFLTYIEDEDEHARIIEKSLHVPGELYQKLAKEKKSIIYKEEAYTTPASNIYVRFINQKLVMVQGNLLDCVY